MADARWSVVAIWTLTLLAIGWCTLLAANDRLRVETPGRFAAEPAEWWLRVWLTPDPDDRWIEAIADGPLYRSMGYTLAGAKAPRVHQLWLRGLPAGCYELRAEIRTVGQDGPIVARAVAPWPLTVLGPGVDATACD